MSAQIKALIQFECRNSTCKNIVNKVGNKYNYYCMNHMRCGMEVTNNAKACEGCLKSFQGENYLTKVMKGELNNVSPGFVPIEINISSPQALAIQPPNTMLHKLNTIEEKDEEVEEKDEEIEEMDEEVSDDDITIYI